MTREDAVEAILSASQLFYVQVVTSKMWGGSEDVTEIYRMSEDQALAAINDMEEGEYEQYIHVLTDRRTLTIGKSRGDAARYAMGRASEFSHFDYNNGNF